jgi:uncharacterized membrane protein YkvA (DUF1232 family)
VSDDIPSNHGGPEPSSGLPVAPETTAIVPAVEILDGEIVVLGPRSWQQLVAEGILALPNLVKLVYRLMRDRRVPVRRKVVVGAIMGYLVSPFDLIPDFIPVVGQVDDLLLVSLAVRRLVDTVGREAALEYWDGTEDTFDIVDALLEWGADLVPAPVRRFLDR